MENSLKTNNMRPLGAVNIKKLQEKVMKIPELLWFAENQAKPNKFEALQSTQHIIFSFIHHWEDHTNYAHRPLWDMWKALIQPILDEVILPFNYDQPHFPRIMLAKMPPHTKIAPHIDAAKAAQFPHKIHVPLQTNPQTFFFHKHQKYHFEVGQAYEVNNNMEHWVVNEGDTDRIHLIFECYNGSH